jgi:DNA-binding MarR family transcriptional regulator
VLKQLIDSGYIAQVEGTEDRRQRHLYPTRAGRDLALDLARPQSRRIGRAFGEDKTDIREDVARFLAGMRDKGGRK